MSWNYRAILHDNIDDPWVGLHEVYYDGDGKPTYWTDDAVEFLCDPDQNIANVLRMALADVEKFPLLKISDLERDFQT